MRALGPQHCPLMPGISKRMRRLVKQFELGGQHRDTQMICVEFCDRHHSLRSKSWPVDNLSAAPQPHRGTVVGRSTDARTFSMLSEMTFVSCITCWLSELYSSISR